MKLAKTATALLLSLVLSACSISSIPTRAPEGESLKESSTKENIAKESSTAVSVPKESTATPVFFPTESTGETVAPIPEGPSAEERAKLYRAYLAFVENNKDIVGGQYYFPVLGKELSLYESLMFWDITGDGLPEMLALSPTHHPDIDNTISLYIFTYENGEIRELLREDGNSAVPDFWSQTYVMQMEDSVCYSVGDTLYVYTLQKINFHGYYESNEEILRIGYDKKKGVILADPVVRKKNTRDNVVGTEETNWFVDGMETATETDYETAKAKALGQAEAGILVPTNYEYWTGERAGMGVRIVYSNRLGMRYQDALSFLEGEIEAAEEDPSFKPEIILMGTLEQDNNPDNGPEPIEWIILTKTDGKALVISRYGLYDMIYGSSIKQTWADSKIRDWLNGTFYVNAFTEEEQKKIELSQVYTEAGSARYSQGGAITTYEFLFLLSADEVLAYMQPHSLRQCFPTASTLSQGLSAGFGGGVDWVLRTYGEYGELSIAYVDMWGILNWHGSNIDNPYAVRPAMWIDLEK